MSGLTIHDDFERFLVDWLDETAGPGSPDYLEETLARLDSVQQRPAWLSPSRWLPVEALTVRRFESARLAPVLVALVLLLILAMVIVIVGSTRSRVPPPFGLAATGDFAFDAGGDIYLAQPDGTLARRIVSTPSYEFGATWSRDGSRLAYWSSAAADGRNASLWVADADGRSPHRVTGDLTFAADTVMPAVDWSPDDRSLAFTTADGRLYVVDVDNSDLRPLGDDSLNRQDPAWSPNGSLIAFHGEGASTGIYVIGSDGSGEIKVSTGPSWPISLRLPSWSPDGQRLLYHVGNPDENDIAIATRTGSIWSETIVVGGPEHDSWPEFSSDASRIAFLRSEPGHQEGHLWTAHADGSRLSQVSDDLVGWSPFCWTPDDAGFLAPLGYLDTAIGDEDLPGFLVISADGNAPTSFVLSDGRVAFAACSWQRLALDAG